MKSTRLVIAMTLAVLLAVLTPAAGQDEVKAEIRQAIDTAYLNSYWNDMNIKTFLAGWDQGAISQMLTPTGDLGYISVMEWISGAVRANRKPPEKKEFKFVYPAIDVAGDMALAQVEVMRGDTIMFTDYFPLFKTKTGWKIVAYPYYMHRDGVRPETPAAEAAAVKKVVEDTLVRGLLGDGTAEQVRTGLASICDINLYLPEVDVVAKVDLNLPLAAKSQRGMKALPIKTSAFTLIAITGHVTAGRLAVTFDSGLAANMYVVLYKLKTGWAIVEMALDKPLMGMFAPPPQQRRLP